MASYPHGSPCFCMCICFRNYMCVFCSKRISGLKTTTNQKKSRWCFGGVSERAKGVGAMMRGCWRRERVGAVAGWVGLEGKEPSATWVRIFRGCAAPFAFLAPQRSRHWSRYAARSRHLVDVERTPAARRPYRAPGPASSFGFCLSTPMPGLSGCRSQPTWRRGARVVWGLPTGRGFCSPVRQEFAQCPRNICMASPPEEAM